MKDYVEKMTALKNKKSELEKKEKVCKTINKVGIWNGVGFVAFSLLAQIIHFPLALSLTVLALCILNFAGVITNAIILGKTENQILGTTVGINDLYSVYSKQKEEENNLTQTLKTESTNTIAQEAVYTEEKTQDKQDEFTM